MANKRQYSSLSVRLSNDFLPSPFPGATVVQIRICGNACTTSPMLYFSASDTLHYAEPGRRSTMTDTQDYHGKLVTIERFILDQQQAHPEATGTLTNILYDLSLIHI